ncbi:hypothetical protein ACA910_012077 [Epithemia clementina (nom. ined.)]
MSVQSHGSVKKSYSRSEWSALSIQERIRAMNETLDDVEEKQQLQQIVPPSATSSKESWSAQDEEEFLSLSTYPSYISSVNTLKSSGDTTAGGDTKTHQSSSSTHHNAQQQQQSQQQQQQQQHSLKQPQRHAYNNHHNHNSNHLQNYSNSSSHKAQQQQHLTSSTPPPSASTATTATGVTTPSQSSATKRESVIDIWRNRDSGSTSFGAPTTNTTATPKNWRTQTPPRRPLPPPSSSVGDPQQHQQQQEQQQQVQQMPTITPNGPQHFSNAAGVPTSTLSNNNSNSGPWHSNKPTAASWQSTSEEEAGPPPLPSQLLSRPITPNAPTLTSTRSSSWATATTTTPKRVVASLATSSMAPTPSRLHNSQTTPPLPWVTERNNQKSAFRSPASAGGPRTPQPAKLPTPKRPSVIADPASSRSSEPSDLTIVPVAAGAAETVVGEASTEPYQEHQQQHHPPPPPYQLRATPQHQQQITIELQEQQHQQQQQQQEQQQHQQDNRPKNIRDFWAQRGLQPIAASSPEQYSISNQHHSVGASPAHQNVATAGAAASSSSSLRHSGNTSPSPSVASATSRVSVVDRWKRRSAGGSMVHDEEDEEDFEDDRANARTKPSRFSDGGAPAGLLSADDVAHMSVLDRWKRKSTPTKQTAEVKSEINKIKELNSHDASAGSTVPENPKLSSSSKSGGVQASVLDRWKPKASAPSPAAVPEESTVEHEAEEPPNNIYRNAADDVRSGSIPFLSSSSTGQASVLNMWKQRTANAEAVENAKQNKDQKMKTSTTAGKSFVAAGATSPPSSSSVTEPTSVMNMWKQRAASFAEAKEVEQTSIDIKQISNNQATNAIDPSEAELPSSPAGQTSALNMWKQRSVLVEAREVEQQRDKEQARERPEKVASPTLSSSPPPTRLSVMDLWKQRTAAVNNNQSTIDGATTRNAASPVTQSILPTTGRLWAPVVDRWSQRSSVAEAQEPKENQTSEMANDLLSPENDPSPPKYSSVADLWNQRLQGAATPILAKIATVGVEEEPQESQTSQMAEDLPSPQNGQLPPKRSSVADRWNQRRQAAATPAQAKIATVDVEEEPKESQMCQMVENLPCPQNDPSLPKRSSAADRWNQRRQASATPTHATIATVDVDEERKDCQTPQMVEDLPSPQNDPSLPKRSSIADRWNQRRQASATPTPAKIGTHEGAKVVSPNLVVSNGVNRWSKLEQTNPKTNDALVPSNNNNNKYPSNHLRQQQILRTTLSQHPVVAMPVDGAQGVLSSISFHEDEKSEKDHTEIRLLDDELPIESAFQPITQTPTLIDLTKNPSSRQARPPPLSEVTQVRSPFPNETGATFSIAERMAQLQRSPSFRVAGTKSDSTREVSPRHSPRRNQQPSTRLQDTNPVGMSIAERMALLNQSPHFKHDSAAGFSPRGSVFGRWPNKHSPVKSNNDKDAESSSAAADAVDKLKAELQLPELYIEKEWDANINPAENDPFLPQQKHHQIDNATFHRDDSSEGGQDGVNVRIRLQVDFLSSQPDYDEFQAVGERSSKTPAKVTDRWTVATNNSNSPSRLSSLTDSPSRKGKVADRFFVDATGLQKSLDDAITPTNTSHSAPTDGVPDFANSRDMQEPKSPEALEGTGVKTDGESLKIKEAESPETTQTTEQIDHSDVPLDHGSAVGHVTPKARPHNKDELKESHDKDQHVEANTTIKEENAGKSAAVSEDIHPPSSSPPPLQSQGAYTADVSTTDDSRTKHEIEQAEVEPKDSMKSLPNAQRNGRGGWHAHTNKAGGLYVSTVSTRFVSHSLSPSMNTSRAGIQNIQLSGGANPTRDDKSRQNITTDKAGDDNEGEAQAIYPNAGASDGKRTEHMGSYDELRRRSAFHSRRLPRASSVGPPSRVASARPHAAQSEKGKPMLSSGKKGKIFLKGRLSATFQREKNLSSSEHKQVSDHKEPNEEARGEESGSSQSGNDSVKKFGLATQQTAGSPKKTTRENIEKMMQARMKEKQHLSIASSVKPSISMSTETATTQDTLSTLDETLTAQTSFGSTASIPRQNHAIGGNATKVTKSWSNRLSEDKLASAVRPPGLKDQLQTLEETSTVQENTTSSAASSATEAEGSSSLHQAQSSSSRSSHSLLPGARSPVPAALSHKNSPPRKPLQSTTKLERTPPRPGPTRQSPVPFAQKQGFKTQSASKRRTPSPVPSLPQKQDPKRKAETDGLSLTPPRNSSANSSHIHKSPVRSPPRPESKSDLSGNRPIPAVSMTNPRARYAKPRGPSPQESPMRGLLALHDYKKSSFGLVGTVSGGMSACSGSSDRSTKKDGNVYSYPTLPTPERGGKKSGGPLDKRLLVLISSQSLSRDQVAIQQKVEAILKAHHIPYEEIDGAIKPNRERRNELFNISGIWAKYPQFFVVSGNRTSYWGDWETLHERNENGTPDMPSLVNIVQSVRGVDCKEIASPKSVKAKIQHRGQLPAKPGSGPSSNNRKTEAFHSPVKSSVSSAFDAWAKTINGAVAIQQAPSSPKGPRAKSLARRHVARRPDDDSVSMSGSQASASREPTPTRRSATPQSNMETNNQQKMEDGKRAYMRPIQCYTSSESVAKFAQVEETAEKKAVNSEKELNPLVGKEYNHAKSIAAKRLADPSPPTKTQSLNQMPLAPNTSTHQASQQTVVSVDANTDEPPIPTKAGGQENKQNVMRSATTASKMATQRLLARKRELKAHRQQQKVSSTQSTDSSEADTPVVKERMKDSARNTETHLCEDSPIEEERPNYVSDTVEPTGSSPSRQHDSVHMPPPDTEDVGDVSCGDEQRSTYTNPTIGTELLEERLSSLNSFVSGAYSAQITGRQQPPTELNLSYGGLVQHPVDVTSPLSEKDHIINQGDTPTTTGDQDVGSPGSGTDQGRFSFSTVDLRQSENRSLSGVSRASSLASRAGKVLKQRRTRPDKHETITPEEKQRAQTTARNVLYGTKRKNGKSGHDSPHDVKIDQASLKQKEFDELDAIVSQTPASATVVERPGLSSRYQTSSRFMRQENEHSQIQPRRATAASEYAFETSAGDVNMSQNRGHYEIRPDASGASPSKGESRAESFSFETGMDTGTGSGTASRILDVSSESSFMRVDKSNQYTRPTRFLHTRGPEPVTSPRYQVINEEDEEATYHTYRSAEKHSSFSLGQVVAGFAGEVSSVLSFKGFHSSTSPGKKESATHHEKKENHHTIEEKESEYMNSVCTDFMQFGPEEEEVAIEVEYMEDSMDDLEEDDGQIVGLCAGTTQNPSELQEQQSTDNSAFDATASCGGGEGKVCTSRERVCSSRDLSFEEEEDQIVKKKKAKRRSASGLC